MKPKAVYIHVPFCEQICHYCDFNKFFLEKQPVDEYLQLCVEEMKHTVKNTPPDEIASVYVGGGTPTSLTTSQLQLLLEGIKAYFPLRTSCEWTVEVNPGSAGREKLEMMRSQGVNRLSIGAQTFDPGLLHAIGRDHQAEDVEKTVRMARGAGFENISIDLMFGLPGQTMEQFKDTLQRVMALSVEHVSAYSLKIEPKTVFYHLWKKGSLLLPEEDTEVEMYEELCSHLKKTGFIQYEISNFAKMGRQSRHNLTYWNNEEYYGIGAGAHSYLSGIRRMNHGPLPKYMESIRKCGLPYREEHRVTVQEKMEEEMFMGLRRLSGVSYATFSQKFGITINEVFPGVVEQLMKKNLLEDTGAAVRLTKNGLLLGNDVFEQFLLS
ncbi:oxygen-independent coproporphyrinogen-3 oxidase [Evansella caseinilytica]|uniref:Heme chaperone HemW n=1 Tax=Evansella caseinilytica TaxID=1503961 RepID=A0A1H3KGT1_9BACI|nr:radical SAM family heme chaperone HemW [Evansella caseinilytica]SDY51230.1 oxygen-independent coproporphyrinogen-3 oxidase [Evansella caseinilytica]